MTIIKVGSLWHFSNGHYHVWSAQLVVCLLANHRNISPASFSTKHTGNQCVVQAAADLKMKGDDTGHCLSFPYLLLEEKSTFNRPNLASRNRCTEGRTEGHAFVMVLLDEC